MIRHVVIGFISLLIVVFVCGCVDAQVVPTVVYKANFDNTKIDAVESIVDEVAQQWKLRPFRKDRVQMERLTFGEDALFVALYFEDNPVLVLTNVGVGKVLTLSTSDFGKMPVEDLNRVANDMIDKLRNRLSIELHVENSQAAI